MLKKKALIIAAAGAVVAASTVPALAFENQFNGYFRLFGAVNNFNASSAYSQDEGAYLPVTNGFYTPEGLEKKALTSTYISQRARLKYTAKASDDLKLVTQFEIDYKYWGDASYTVGRNVGGALGADTVNIETKHVYLDFNVPQVKGLNVKVGMQPVDDAFKGVFFGADVAGLRAAYSKGAFDTTVGLYRFNDTGYPPFNSVTGAGIAPYGKRTRDMVSLEGNMKVSDKTRIGGAYYFVNDDRLADKTNLIHLLGINGEQKLGNLTLNGFFAYEFGKLEDPAERNIRAFAANVGAKYQIGKGTFRSEFLYTSGEGSKSDTGSTTAFQSIDDEHGYYDGNMILLFRDPYSMTIDNAIVYTSNNRDQGVIAGFIGYDHQCTSKLTSSVNAGFAAVAKDRGQRKSSYLGTEVNVQADYKLYDNLSVIARGAYVILGDYYKGVAADGKTPDNPYMANLILNYTF